MVTRSAGDFQLGVTRRHPESSNSPGLKVSKDSHRIRKPPLPLPPVQYRPPIIIHTYSPKIIHAEPDDFMSLVQKLTGSSDTRLRLKKSPGSSKQSDKPVSSSAGARQSADAGTALERQGSGASSMTNCGSPASSEDSATFLVSDQACHGGEAATSKQSNSPRSPLDSGFEFDCLLNPFEVAAGSGVFTPQVKAEPVFSFHESHNQPFSNAFADFMHHGPGVLAKPRAQTHQHQDLMMSPYVDTIVPAPGLMDHLSPQGWSQSTFLDCLSGAGSHFVNPAPYLRQRQFSGPSYAPSPEGSTMVALENIHAFMLT